jgi:hypothetical protein
VVDENHKTHLQALSIGRDYGTALEVLDGLKPTDWIVVNPADSLEEGMQVNVKQLPNAAPPVGVSPPTQGAQGPQGGGAQGNGGSNSKGNSTAAPSGNKR